MKTLKKSDVILKWIFLIIAIVNLLTYFMPIYQSVYRDNKPEIVYLYGGSSSHIIISFTNLLIPILALVLLFSNFKNSKLFFFGFSLTYILNSIFALISIKRAISDNDNEYYELTYKYGYYFFIYTTILLAVFVFGLFVLYLINKVTDANIESEECKQAKSQNLEIDVMKQRIDLLNDLKAQGYLSEVEYDKKRAEIINELKL